MAEKSNEAPLLVIDDDSSILRLLDKFLTKKGHNVVVASNAEDAMEILKQNQNIGAILSDLKMPGKDGDEMVKDIRGMGSDIPVYIMTGFPENDKINRLNSYGVTEIVLKPLDLQSLEEKLYFKKNND
ncbi:Regulator of RpoS [Candidatus Lokiarchaeum ossiferum]|uniref:Regulator of RpoS n=1 Tax=Candidatus Lokiarchaeum ossiferum TaxID=2951803 RepID=A0ABY6HUD0_9ARCH|nr:Regulator of RpoS [Candidatus Lokiarchaeum sp. B-35]